MCQDFFQNSYTLQDDPWYPEYDNLLFIGGATNIRGTKNDWRWISDGKRVKYSMPWAEDWQLKNETKTKQDEASGAGPGYGSRNNFCLGLGGRSYQFKAASCENQSKKFICQSKSPYKSLDEPEEAEANIQN